MHQKVSALNFQGKKNRVNFLILKRKKVKNSVFMRVLSSLGNSLISETSLCDYTPNLISSLQHENLPHTDLLFDFPPLHPTGANSMPCLLEAPNHREGTRRWHTIRQTSWHLKLSCSVISRVLIKRTACSLKALPKFVLKIKVNPLAQLIDSSQEGSCSHHGSVARSNGSLLPQPTFQFLEANQYPY